jgi:ElaB/YqjD/DUF883 family membrane-anchored ribosome-binding protein
MDTVSRERLASDVKVVLDDVEALLRQAADSTGQQALDLRQRAAAALRTAQEHLQEVQETVMEKSRFAARATDGWVHENAWSAIGIGVGVGFLIGLLVGRR